MRVKLPKNKIDIDSLGRLDSETIQKLHEGRRKIEYYFDQFELVQFNAVASLEDLPKEEDRVV